MTDADNAAASKKAEVVGRRDSVASKNAEVVASGRRDSRRPYFSWDAADTAVESPNSSSSRANSGSPTRRVSERAASFPIGTTRSALTVQLPADPHTAQRLPEAAKGSQLRAALAPGKEGDPTFVDFPGEAETLDAQWPTVCWEISGVRAVGAAYLTCFRLILHAELPDAAVLDVGLADVRSMHLEVPIGAMDTVERGARAAFVRQAPRPFAAHSQERVDEVILHCQDFRNIRLFALTEIARGNNMPQYAYSAEKTTELLQRLQDQTRSARPVNVSRRECSAWRSALSNFSRSAPVIRDKTCGSFSADNEIHRSDTTRLPSQWDPLLPGRLSFSEAFVQLLPSPMAGWEHGADAFQEFFTEQRVPASRWRLAETNESYLLCDSYPSQLVVPTSADDSMLIAAASIRKHRRLPVLTYYHRGRGSVLLRCSQPSGHSHHHRDGLQADRDYLELCRKAAGTYASLCIFDCRSQVAAWGATIAKGGGQSNPREYTATNCREGDVGTATLMRLDVPNIYEMRSSWGELRALVEQSDIPENKWLQKLGDTMWLDHCRRITEAAVTVARMLADGAEGQPPACVVVHCSDGWDRTSQVVSLAQILCDHRYRTSEGLVALIEKDWRRFGHRFADRYMSGGAKASPIFLQWLFCVAAVVLQFPDEFEYTSADLMFLADLRICGGLGTFLFNSEREAVEAEAERTHTCAWSLWLQAGVSEGGYADQQQMLPRLGVFRVRSCRARTGTDWKSDHSEDQDVLLPVTSLKRFVLWEWAMRFNEVAFSRKKVYSKGAHSANAQALGPGLVRMVRDSASAECTACKGDFGMVRRRHHCRACGLLFCANCLQWSARLPHRADGEMQGGTQEKVCRRCFELSRGDFGNRTPGQADSVVTALECSNR